MRLPSLYVVAGGELHKAQLRREGAAGAERLVLQWRAGARPRRVYLAAVKPRRSSNRNLAGIGS